MRYYVTLNQDEEIAVDINRLPNGQLLVKVDDEQVDVDAVTTGAALNVRVGNRVFDLCLDAHGEALDVIVNGQRLVAHVQSERTRIGAAAARNSHAGGGEVCAPMPGRVVKLLVAEGDSVAAGTPVVVVEAMKMENEIFAETGGRVDKLCVSPGEAVDGGTCLVRLSAAPPTES